MAEGGSGTLGLVQKLVPWWLTLRGETDLCRLGRRLEATDYGRPGFGEGVPGIVKEGGLSRLDEDIEQLPRVLIVRILDAFVSSCAEDCIRNLAKLEVIPGRWLLSVPEAVDAAESRGDSDRTSKVLREHEVFSVWIASRYAFPPATNLIEEQPRRDNIQGALLHARRPGRIIEYVNLHWKLAKASSHPSAYVANSAAQTVASALRASSHLGARWSVLLQPRESCQPIFTAEGWEKLLASARYAEKVDRPVVLFDVLMPSQQSKLIEISWETRLDEFVSVFAKSELPDLMVRSEGGASLLEGIWRSVWVKESSAVFERADRMAEVEDFRDAFIGRQSDFLENLLSENEGSVACRRVWQNMNLILDDAQDAACGGFAVCVPYATSR